MNLSIAKAANKLDVIRQHLNKVVIGKSAISAEMAVRFEAVFGSSAQYWLVSPSAYDLAQIRLIHADLTKGLKKVEAAYDRFDNILLYKTQEKLKRIILA